MKNILYSCYLVTGFGQLALKQFTSDLPNKFGHHVTIEFKPKEPVKENVQGNIHAIGRLITDRVDVLLIDPKDYSGANKIPHITLATAEGVKPFESNKALQEYNDKIVYFPDPISIHTVTKNILQNS